MVRKKTKRTNEPEGRKKSDNRLPFQVFILFTWGPLTTMETVITDIQVATHRSRYGSVWMDHGK